MRLFEIREGKVFPYWLRNGKLVGVSFPIPVSEHFALYGIRRIGRGHLCPVIEKGQEIVALLPQCDPDSGVLIMIEAPEIRVSGGFIRLSNEASHIVELLPGGSIEVRGRKFVWNGRDLKRI